jgi:AbrB family looped-hinge helix DNA binding protein
MKAIRFSARYGVTIPKAVREQLRLRPGQRLQALVHGECLALVPLRKAAELRGRFRGLDTSVERDTDRA